MCGKVPAPSRCGRNALLLSCSASSQWMCRQVLCHLVSPSGLSGGSVVAPRCRNSRFTATKKDCRTPSGGWTDPLVGAVPGIYRLLSDVGLWFLVHSCRSANLAITALQTGGCASNKRRDNVTHIFTNKFIVSKKTALHHGSHVGKLVYSQYLQAPQKGGFCGENVALPPPVHFSHGLDRVSE